MLAVCSVLFASPPPLADVGRTVQMVEKRYHSANKLKATFLERYSEGRGDLHVESGTVYFSQPGRMRWEYESPERKLFLVDGKTAWFYVPADRTASRAPLRESSDWRTPLALLAGKAKLSSYCGHIELATGAPPDGHVVLRCLPRGNLAARGDEEPYFREVLLEVDAATGDLARVLIRRAGEVEIEYRFADWQKNLPLPEALFHFSPPAGVAIVDESSIGGVIR